MVIFHSYVKLPEGIWAEMPVKFSEPWRPLFLFAFFEKSGTPAGRMGHSQMVLTQIEFSIWLICLFGLDLFGTVNQCLGTYPQFFEINKLFTLVSVYCRVLIRNQHIFFQKDYIQYNNRFVCPHGSLYFLDGFCCPPVVVRVFSLYFNHPYVFQLHLAAINSFGWYIFGKRKLQKTNIN